MAKGNVFRLNLSESREGFCRRWRGRSFDVDGPKAEKAREPTVESLVRGIWRLRVSEAERRVRRVCNVEDSHKDRTEQCPWYNYSRESLSCTEFFVGLKAGGNIQIEAWCGQLYVYVFVCFCFVFFVFVFFSMRRAEQFCMWRWLLTGEAGRPEKRELQ